MTETGPYGQLLAGDESMLRASYAAFEAMPVDQVMDDGVVGGRPPRQTTLGRAVSVSGPGTFLGQARRRLTFEPTRERGWWFDRIDLPRQMPIHVSVENVWTTLRNIVLSSGSPHNYMRMVEHIIPLRLGLGIDNVMIRMESGDPPLFDRGSLDLVEALDEAGTTTLQEPADVVTVREPVSIVSKSGRMLIFLPAEPGSTRLDIDCALDFRTAIGRQRIQFTVTPDVFRYGAIARTNTTFLMVLFCKTIGKIFADTRNLGYTRHNILIAGRRRYANPPRLLHEGKSLEAAWHRAALDLLAAVALIDRGRFAGRIISYKAGHTLDVQMIRELYRRDLLVEV